MDSQNFSFEGNKDSNLVRTICHYSSKTGKVTWHFKSFRDNLDINFSKEIRWRELKIDVEITTDLHPEIDTPSKIRNKKNNQKISIIKSNLQKAIRRQNLNSAIESAIELYNLDKLVLARRLAIISVEDVILLEDFPYLLFSIAVYPGIKPNLNIMLRMIEALVKSSERDYLPDDNTFTVRELSLNSLVEVEKGDLLNDLEISLVYSLYLRSSYGGLKSDIDMLIGYGQLWKDRFLGSKKDYWNDYLIKTSLMIKTSLILENPIPKNFIKQFLILECIDFHTCPYMLKEIGYYIKSKRINEDFIKKIIWYCRSGINTRGNTEDFTKNKDKYQIVYKKIEGLIDKYSEVKLRETFTDG